ncbi:MAG: nucleotidyltransferase substrate binding protein [Bacteroidales bacterium]|jgi:nucleotidyltransferase substrate binding protein (TIGR01987 family)
MEKDIRWLQRFSNLKKAYKNLESAAKVENLSELEQEGLIHRFEYTYELSWNTIKDLLEYQGFSGITGSRDAFRLAFERGLIKNGEVWMKMIGSRQKTSHMYDQEEANEIAEIIVEGYIPKFKDLIKQLEKEAKKLKN